jgi:hypothetical protein
VGGKWPRFLDIFGYWHRSDRAIIFHTNNAFACDSNFGVMEAVPDTSGEKATLPRLLISLQSFSAAVQRYEIFILK